MNITMISIETTRRVGTGQAVNAGHLQRNALGPTCRHDASSSKHSAVIFRCAANCSNKYDSQSRNSPTHFQVLTRKARPSATRSKIACACESLNFTFTTVQSGRKCVSHSQFLEAFRCPGHNHGCVHKLDPGNMGHNPAVHKRRNPTRVDSLL